MQVLFNCHLSCLKAIYIRKTVRRRNGKEGIRQIPKGIQVKRWRQSKKLIYDSFTTVFQNCFCNSCFVPLTKVGYSLCFEQLGLCYHSDGKPLKLTSLRCDCSESSVSDTTSFQQTKPPTFERRCYRPPSLWYTIHLHWNKSSKDKQTT